MSELKQDNTIWQQLLYYRTITERMGILHEPQTFQLTMWGEVLFSDFAKDIEVHAFLPYMEHEGTPAETLHDERVIEYRMSMGDGPIRVRIRKLSPQVKGLLEGLDRSVKQLLGDNFVTRVVVNDDTIFESGAKAKEIKDEHRTYSA